MAISKLITNKDFLLGAANSIAAISLEKEKSSTESKQNIASNLNTCLATYSNNSSEVEKKYIEECSRHNDTKKMERYMIVKKFTEGAVAVVGIFSATACYMHKNRLMSKKIGLPW